MDIPGYYTVDTLGEGRSATVYLAIMEDGEKEVALKIFSRQLSSDTDFSEKFTRQVRLLSGLEHPNIATVYDWGSHEEQFYLAMEFVQGRNLRHKRFDLGLQEQLQLVGDLARALEFASQRKFVHGNIKPENIILRARDGYPVLVDFGMSRFSGAGMDQASLLGQDCYLSPEQRKGEPFDGRSDIWSLGRVLLLLLQGQFPQSEARRFEAFPLQLPPGLMAFQPVLERALAENPSDRYQSGSGLAQALSEITQKQIQQAISAAEQALMEANEEEPRPTVERQPEPVPPKGKRRLRVVSEKGAAIPEAALAGDRDTPADTLEESEFQDFDGEELYEPDAVVRMTAHPDDRIDLREPMAQGGWGSVALWGVMVLALAGLLLFAVRPG